MTQPDAKAVLSHLVEAVNATDAGDVLYLESLGDPSSELAQALRWLVREGYLRKRDGSTVYLTSEGLAWLNEPQRGNGLQWLKRWSLAVGGCANLGPMEKVTALLIREYAHASDGTVYVGLDRLSEDAGLDRAHLTRRRAKVIKAGWLTPTGEKRGRGAELLSVTVPTCDCKNCTRGVQTGAPVGVQTGAPIQTRHTAES